MSSKEEEKSKYLKMWFGVELFSALDVEEQKLLSPFVAEPLLAFEQLIMNTRLDSVSILLKRVCKLFDL